jgi:hypothetical protein
MAVKISREGDGSVSLIFNSGLERSMATVSQVEARLIAIKLLLAAEDLPAPESGRG